MLPSSDAGASETLFPDTMANCHLPIILEFPSGFWALRFHLICLYGHTCDLCVWIGMPVEIREQPLLLFLKHSPPCFLRWGLSLVKNSPSRLAWLGQGDAGIHLHLHSAGMAEHTGSHLTCFTWVYMGSDWAVSTALPLHGIRGS